MIKYNFLRFATLLFATLAIFTAGCTPDKDDSDDSGDNLSPEKKLTVRVAFVGEPSIGQIIEKQWKASGHSIELKTIQSDELADAKKLQLLEYDVVIYPPNMIGTLVSQNSLESLSANQLDANQLKPADILRIQRNDLVSYGGKSWGVSLGAPTFSLIYREDIFEQLQLQVPRTWEQYEKAALALAQQKGKLKDKDGKQFPTTVIEPCGEDWAGKLLMLRAASAMCQRGQMETIMKLDDAKPLVNASPYVRALQSLQRSFDTGNLKLADSPTVAFQEIATGKAAMAIGWPSASVKLDNVNENLSVTDIPVEEKMFDVIGMKWMDRIDAKTKAVLLGFEGKIASIVSRARHKEDAEYFLSWLAGPESAGRIWIRSPHCSISRGSQISKPYRWCGQNVPRQVGDGYAKIIKNANSNGLAMHCLRLPGQNEYMAALNQAVVDCIKNKKDAKTALDAVAQSWRNISEKRGLDAQALENRRSLGLTN